MNLADARGLTKSRLARFTGSVLDGHVDGELRAAQNRLENDAFLPWFLESAATATLLAGGSSFDVPTGFIREVDMEEPYATNTVTGATLYLKKKDRKFLRAKTKPGVSAPPRWYIISGMKYDVGSPADVEYSLDLTFYKKDTELLTDTDTNLWLAYASDYLIAEAGFVIARGYLKNEAAAAVMKEIAAEEKLRLMQASTAREDVNMDYQRD